METHKRKLAEKPPVVYHNARLNRRLMARDLSAVDGQEKGWVHALQYAWRRHYARRRTA